MHTSTVLLLAVAVLCNCSDPITISPLGDVLISKSSNDNVTFNCTFLTTTGHDSSSILWKIGNATLLDRDQYAGFGVNALDSAHRNFSQLFLSPSGRMWLFNEIEEMNISIQCLGSERNFIVTERGPIFSLVVCGTVPKVRALRVDLLNGWSVVSWNRPSIFQPLVLTYNVVITDENGMKLNESNTTGREVTLPMDFKCDKCQVSVKAQNDNCDDSETAVWDMGPIPICITLAPFTRSSIEYTCNDDENQKAMVNFPEANGAAVVNRTVTVTASGVLINVSETGNTGSVEITGLIKQSRYYVVVTMCTDRCCQETKAVTLSTSCVKYCSVKYFRTFAGIRCKFSEVEDASSNDTGVQLVFTINGEETTINISRESAIAGYSPSQILISGIDVRSYDWNPKTGTTGSLPVETSITTVTSREDFDFSIETEMITEENDDDHQPCGILCVGLIVGFGALILGALLGIIFTCIVFKCCCKNKEETLRGLPLKDNY